VSTKLQGKTVLVIGRAGGIARAIASAARAEGADVVVAGRNRDALTSAYGDSGITVESVDLTDERSVAALAERLGEVDHVVSTASARARGALGDLAEDAVLLSLRTKVVGPIILAKHFATRVRPGGSLLIFSGSTAVKPSPGWLAVAATNGAVDVLVRGLAVELAPTRVNAISPGTIDSGAYDGLGEQKKAEFYQDRGAHNPARRVGTVEDIADAAVFAMSSTFMTGVSLRIDGGEPLV
jgi:NAD(P)-dependent dehydrogenase (short-subunit alcohol dehydrogenase family)